MVTIRPAKASDALGIAEVQVAAWLSTYTGIVPERHFAERMTVPKRARRWEEILAAGTSITCVALVNHRVVGFVSGEPASAGGDGELKALYVLEEFHRRGIGASLFDWIVEVLLEEGCSKMVCWVLVGNPAAAFYEAMGGARLDTEKTIEMSGVDLPLLGFVWSPLVTRSVTDPT